MNELSMNARALLETLTQRAQKGGTGVYAFIDERGTDGPSGFVIDDDVRAAVDELRREKLDVRVSGPGREKGWGMVSANLVAASVTA